MSSNVVPTYKRLMLPSARPQFDRIGNDYGLTNDLDQFCRDLTNTAASPNRPLTEVAIHDIFDELESGLSTPQHDWARAWRMFRDAGWLDKVKSLRALMAKRRPPWQLRITCHIFRGLGDVVPVEVEIVYDINHVDETVTFIRFESYTPTSQSEGSTPNVW